MSDTAIWLGSNLVQWGDGRPQQVTSWGDLIPVVDPPTPLTDLGLDLKNSPRKVWRTQQSLRKVVSFAAEKISAVPLHVYQRISDTDRERDTTSEELLRNPAPFVTGIRLINDLIIDWMLYDRFLLILLDGRLVRIPAGLIDVKSDFLGGLTSLKVRTGDGLIDVTDSVCAYDAGWAGDDEGGVSPLKTLSTTLEEQRRATTWRAMQWQNAVKLSGTLNLPLEARIPDKKYERMKESFKRYQNNLAGGTPILEYGAHFEKFDMSPVVTDDLDGRRLTDAEVASFYHIPPELVGAREGTFANIKAFREMLYGPTFGPRMARIEAALNHRIIPFLAGDDAYVEFNREAAMAGSFAEQATIYQKAAGGPYLTRNEVRARQNLPSIDGADELIIPKNVTEGGLASPADTAPEGENDGA